MQKISFYLLPNRITVIAGVAGLITEYRKVFQRNIKLYKGINNTIQIDVKNADQKRVDIRNYTPYIRLFDSEQKLLLSKYGTINMATPGLFTVIFDETELNQIQNQQLKLVTYLNESGGDIPLYAGTQFDISVTVDLEDGYNDKRRSSTGNGQIITTFTLNYGEDAFYSQVAYFKPLINSDVIVTTVDATIIDIDNSIPINAPEGQYTPITYYTGTYHGRIDVEVSNNDSTALGNTWTLIRTDMVNSNAVVNITLSGDYQFIRFKISNNQGMMDKILIEN